MQTQRFSDRSSQSRFDAEQSLNARCSELVLMRVYFTQQQQTQKKRKGAKFLNRACVRCGCAIQVADGAIKAAKDAARVDAHMDDKRGRQACDRLREARATEEAAAAAAAGGGGGGQRHALGTLQVVAAPLPRAQQQQRQPPQQVARAATSSREAARAPAAAAAHSGAGAQQQQQRRRRRQQQQLPAAVAVVAAAAAPVASVGPGASWMSQRRRAEKLEEKLEEVKAAMAKEKEKAQQQIRCAAISLGPAPA